MTLMARYSGVCPECDEPWQPGDLIRADNRRWKHAVCPNPGWTVKAGEIRCPDCWLIHPEGACDR